MKDHDTSSQPTQSIQSISVSANSNRNSSNSGSSSSNSNSSSNVQESNHYSADIRTSSSVEIGDTAVGPNFWNPHMDPYAPQPIRVEVPYARPGDEGSAMEPSFSFSGAITLTLHGEHYYIVNNLSGRDLQHNYDRTSLVLMTLSDPNLWIKPITWTRIFSKSRSNTNQLLNYGEVIQSMQHGTPTKTESDQCVIEIVRSNLKEECEIPGACVATLMKEDNTTGYPLTHRLLIVQVAKALECKDIKMASLLSLVPTYCTRIFQDLVNLEAWNFPNVARDLIIEQIILCGMEGYYEFVDKHYENIILSWPHWSGCFGIFGYSNEHKITRRSSSTTDFGCENHTTSLAAASLAIFIRENIENNLSQS